MARESFITTDCSIIREAIACLREGRWDREKWMDVRIPRDGNKEQWLGRVVKIEIVERGHEITMDRGI